MGEPPDNYKGNMLLYVYSLPTNHTGDLRLPTVVQDDRLFYHSELSRTPSHPLPNKKKPSIVCDGFKSIVSVNNRLLVDALNEMHYCLVRTTNHNAIT